jgi:hypothetical protein
MSGKQETRARRLPSHPVRWLLGSRKLAIKVGDGSDQPFICMVAEAKTQAVRAIDLQTSAPDAREASALLYEAMLSPMPNSGGRYRPAEVAMDDARLYRDLAPTLERIGVRAVWERTLPMLDEIARRTEQWLRRGPEPVGLAGAPGTTPAQLAEFYAAAAEFHVAAPWRWLGSADPIAVRCPADAEPVFVMLVAGDTERPGLNVCLCRDDLERYTGEGEVDENTGDMVPEVPVLVMFYTDASAMAPQDLHAIKRYGWTIHDDQAYPIFVHADPKAGFSPPSAENIWRTAAIMRKLPEFISAVGFDQGWARDAHEVYALPAIYPERTIALTFPHDLRPGVYIPIEPYEAIIEGWCPDESRRPLGLALAMFMARILTIMNAQGYSRSTIEQYSRAFNAIGWLQCRYGPYETFSPALFASDPPLEDEFRAFISPAKTALQQYRRAWRKLLAWTHLLETLPPDLLGTKDRESA